MFLVLETIEKVEGSICEVSTRFETSQPSNYKARAVTTVPSLHCTTIVEYGFGRNQKAWHALTQWNRFFFYLSNVTNELVRLAYNKLKHGIQNGQDHLRQHNRPKGILEMEQNNIHLGYFDSQQGLIEDDIICLYPPEMTLETGHLAAQISLEKLQSYSLQNINQ